MDALVDLDPMTEMLQDRYVIKRMKNVILWDVTPCGPCKNYCFLVSIASIIRVQGIGELGTMLAVTINRSRLQLLLTANVNLMMDMIHSSETSVLMTVTWHHIPEDSILHSHCCENLNFCRKYFKV
jgi:hypothetical protein